jgi:ketosteroid isomerase-like protein
MAETPESEATTSADNTHWGIAYLREDLQDIRLQMREDSKELREQIAETNKRIDEVNQSLGQRIAETNKRIDDTNKILESRFIWLITTMVAIAGILIAVIKL